MVYCGVEEAHSMSSPKEEQATRVSVTFPAHLYSSIEIIAKKKKVSLAWVIRDAVEKYVSDLTPLFPEKYL